MYEGKISCDDGQNRGMNMDEREKIHNDYLESNDIALIMINTMHSWISEPRINRTVQLYSMIYDPELMDWDDLEDSLRLLESKDIVAYDPKKNKYRLTDYGVNLSLFTWKVYDDKAIDGILNTARAVQQIPDEYLTGVVAHYYLERKENNVFWQYVDKYIDRCLLDGKPLKEYPLKRFEKKVRKGNIIKWGEKIDYEEKSTV